MLKCFFRHLSASFVKFGKFLTKLCRKMQYSNFGIEKTQYGRNKKESIINAFILICENGVSVTSLKFNKKLI